MPAGARLGFVMGASRWRICKRRFAIRYDEGDWQVEDGG